MSSHSLVAPDKLAKAVNYVAAQVRISRNKIRSSIALTGKISEKAVDDETLNDANTFFLKFQCSDRRDLREGGGTRACSWQGSEAKETETNIVLMITKLLKYFERRVDNLADALDNQSRMFDKVINALADDKTALTDAVADDKAALSAFDHKFNAKQSEVDDIAENMEAINNNFTYLLRRLEDCVSNLADESTKKKKAKGK